MNMTLQFRSRPSEPHGHTVGPRPAGLGRGVEEGVTGGQGSLLQTPVGPSRPTSRNPCQKLPSTCGIGGVQGLPRGPRL